MGFYVAYPCHPTEVLQKMKELRDLKKCVFIKGNHDQFYFNFELGKTCIDYKVADFVEESVSWTTATVDISV